MRLDERALVGDDRARRVGGHWGGGDALVLGGDPSDDLRETAEQVDLKIRPGPADPEFFLSLAEAAEEDSTRPLVLLAAEVSISPVALLDLVDSPNDRTAALTLGPEDIAAGAESLAAVRFSRQTRRVLSLGTAHHVVTNPTGYVVGVVRIRAADRPTAADIWRDAARTSCDPCHGPRGDGQDDRFELALLSLVRGGLDVVAAPLGPYSLRRGAAIAPGVPGSAWQQRLRNASRGDDGVFSTAVIRPLSRRVTAQGLRLGWTPNVVTVVSLLLGLGACALAALDSRLAWILAAVLLMASLVVDCVDGEIARFTRRYSAMGAWLDGVADRAKEFLMVASVAWVAARRGEPMWSLAIVLLALLALRHLEDYAYVRRGRCAAAGVLPDRLPLDVRRDLGPPDAPTRPSPPTTRSNLIRKAKQVLHLPIAERYLIMTLGLLIFSPELFLWALLVAVGLAFGWTEVGRLGRVLLGRDDFDSAHGDDQLPELTDLGLLAGPTAGLTSRLVRSPLAWQLPWLLLAAEAVAVLVSLRDVASTSQWVGYAWLVAVAWHRYDLVYRLRETGRGSPPWLGWVTLGAPVRIALLLLAAAFGWPVVAILGWGALSLMMVYAAESAFAWSATFRSSRPHEEVTP